MSFLSRSTVAGGEERTRGQDYLLKRHSSEGPNRRRFRAELPPELADLEDHELDDRNARVWAVVLADCQRAAGLEPDAFPDCSSVGKPSAHGIALRAALRIARTDYGIPTARLAELADRTPQHVCQLLSFRRASQEIVEGVNRVHAAWVQQGGPARVQESGETRQVDLPAHVYVALQVEAARSGEGIATVVARLVQAAL